MKEKYNLPLSKPERDYLEKGFDFSTLTSLGQNYINYFERGYAVNASLLFIDICNFSTRYSDLCGPEISQYFQQYYDIVMPIVFKYGGVIERVIGDGIVALFGKPFLELSPTQIFPYADRCAREILLKTNGTKFSSKVAFHSGKIQYFKNNSGYEDFTIIGKVVTELFRLEGISVEESINYFGRGVVKIYYDQYGLENSSISDYEFGHWTEYYTLIQPQKGTDYNALYYLQHRKY